MEATSYALRFLGALCMAAVLAAIPARADVSFNGFGQVVVGSSLGNDHPFPSEEYAADPSFTPESLFALQVRAPLANDLSATAQIVADGSNGDDFKPTFAWAYVNYDVGEHWSVKAGRQQVPLYQYSDYLQVGEAYPWIHPPLSTYVVPLTNFDGISLSADYSAGDWEFRPKAVYGNFIGNTNNIYSIQETLTVHVTNLTGIEVESTYADWLSLRASYFQGSGTLHAAGVDQLLQSLQYLGDTRAYAALAADNDYARFEGIGFQINRNHVMFGGEYTNIVLDNSFLPANKGYYLTTGYHFGRLMPLLTFGHAENRPTSPGLPASVYAPPAPPAAPGSPGFPAYLAYETYLGVTQLIQQSHTIDDYYEVGARYDITSNTALKLDYSRYHSGVPGISGANLLSAAFTFSF